MENVTPSSTIAPTNITSASTPSTELSTSTVTSTPQTKPAPTLNSAGTAMDIRKAVTAAKPLVNDIEVAAVEVKAGYKTTEFWLHFLVTVLGIVVALVPNNTIVDVLGAMTSLSSVSIYSIGRVLQKLTALN